MKNSHPLRKTSWLVLFFAMQLCFVLAAAQRGRPPVRVKSAVGAQPELIVQLGFSNGVTCIAFSPDGRLILAGSMDKTARLWETATGRLIRRLGKHDYELEDVEFSTDGRYVMTVTEETFRVWNTATGQELYRFKRTGGDTILSSEDKRYRMELVGADQFVPSVLRNVVTKKELARFGGPEGTSSKGKHIKSPDGRFTLEVGEAKSVVLKSAKTGLEIRSLIGHTDEVNALAFSPDSRLIATGSGYDSYKDNSLRLWDVETGQEVRRFEGDATLVHAVSFSPDGRFIETEGGEPDALVGQMGGGGSVLSSTHLWDMTTGQQVRTLNTGVTSIVAVNMSPNGHFILTGEWEKARLWNTDTGEEAGRFSRHASWVRAVAFSADGRLVVTGSSDHTARLWDAVTGKELQRFLGHTDGIDSVALSPDNKLLLTANLDGAVRLWDTATGAEIARKEATYPCAFSPDGKFYVTDSPRGATLWDTKSGNVVRVFGKPSDDSLVNAVAFSPDGKFVLTANDDHKLRLWDVGNGQEVRPFIGHEAHVHSVAFSNDGRWILSGSGDVAQDKDTTARLWDVATGRQVQQFGQLQNPVFYVAFAPDGQSVWVEDFKVYGGDQTGVLGRGRVHRYDIATGKELALIGEDTVRRAAIFSADGNMVLIGRSDQTVRLLDATTSRELRRLPGLLAAISPDSRFIVTAFPYGSSASRKSETGEEIGATDIRARVVFLWDATTGQEVRRFVWEFASHSGNADDSDLIKSLAFSPNGRFIVAGEDSGVARMFEVATGQELQQFKGDGEATSLVEFTPDGRFVKTSSGVGAGADARLWDAATGKEVRRFAINNGGDEAVGDYAESVTAVALSDDGRYGLSWGFNSGIDQMAFGDTSTPRMWDAATMKELQRFSGHTDEVFSAAFSADNRLVLTGSKDSTTRLWDARTGKEICRLISFRDGTWVAVAPDGRFDTNNLDEIRGLHWIFPDDPLRLLPLEIFMRIYYEPRLLARILAGEKFAPVPPLASLNRIQPTVRITQITPQANAPDQVSVKVELVNVSVGARHSGVSDLRLFRDGQLVGYAPDRGGLVQVNSRTGKAEMVFSNIKLPRREDVLKVEFSAYAFNSDRVKSLTNHMTYELPAPLKTVKGRAYLVTVGVNVYENFEVTKLLYPASDARLMSTTLSDTLRQTGHYAEIVTVPMIADIRERPGEQVVRPTRENFKTVLALLAGKQVGAPQLAAIPAEIRKNLHAARPEDLVIISFSTHGQADGQGNFYLYPYDTGQTNEGLLQHCISSIDLSEWLRDVDAGELVMILDACHSGAAPGEDFKPGPMGSRGLGQLAYDKGMRILAATQADNVAQGSGQSARGLLTTALIRYGIEKGEAARSRRITMRDWLEYGVKEVPVLYNQEVGMWSQQKVQQPALFDFAPRKRDDVVVALLHN
jgi:WD40 repeat protein